MVSVFGWPDPNTWESSSTSIPGPFLELGREKALTSAGHMTPRISGCKNMLISVVSVSVCINNNFLTFYAMQLALR